MNTSQSAHTSNYRRRFSRLTYAAPFGKFVGNSEIEPPADEVLLGREGQRAYLIDLLINMGRQGSYLVTGQRGAGKTSFVRYCIDEYKASVFKRFLSSNTGRGFWDRLLLTGMAISAIVSLLIFSELSQLLSPIITQAGGHRLLVVSMLLPIALVLLLPCLYARELIEAMISVRDERQRRRRPLKPLNATVISDYPSALPNGFSGQQQERREASPQNDKRDETLESLAPRRLRSALTPTRSASVAATLITIAVAVIAYFVLPLGSAEVSTVRFFCILCALYWTVQCTAFKITFMPSRHTNVRLGLCIRVIYRNTFARILGWLRSLRRVTSSEPGRNGTKVDWFARTHTIIPLAMQHAHKVPVLLFWPVALIFLIAGPSGRIENISSEPFLDVAVGTWVLALGLYARYRYQRHRMARAAESLRQASRRGSRSYLFAAILLSLLSPCIFFLWLNRLAGMQDAKTTLVLPVLLGYFGIPFLLTLLMSGLTVRGLKSAGLSVRFTPKLYSLLFLKTIFAVSISLQLLNPIIATVPHVPLMRLENRPREIPALSAPMDSKGVDILPASRSRFQGFFSTLQNPLALSKLPAFGVKSRVFSWYDAQQTAILIINRDTLPGLSVFQKRSHEVIWAIGLLLSLGILYFAEYEWIVKPGSHARQDGSLEKSAEPDWRDGHNGRGVGDRSLRRLYRKLARLTMPWVVYKHWLPVIVVEVNLGFDGLDHRRVVHAMLVGLRKEYHRCFLAWGSGNANLIRFFVLALLVITVTLLGEAWFRIPSYICFSDEVSGLPGDLKGIKAASPDTQSSDTRAKGQDADTMCRQIRSLDHRDVGLFVKPICLIGGDTALEIIYLDFVPGSVRRIEQMLAIGNNYWNPRDPSPAPFLTLLIFDLLPHSTTALSPGDFWSRRSEVANQSSLLPNGLHLCIFHLLILLLGLTILRWGSWHFSILPYKQNLRRMDDMLDSLSSRTTVTTRSNLWKPAQWIYGYFSDEKIKQTDSDPVDPRVVEIAFLNILDDIQRGGVRIPGGSTEHVTVPIPEITFCFDELDKLGTRLDADLAAVPPISETVEILHAERQRSIALLALLSDLKNILSAAPARFLFVGGRNLHDEWLADQTSRQPLLTNVFNAEIYLPSLLTDSDHRSTMRFSDNINQYLAIQHRRAEYLYNISILKQWRPSFGLSVPERCRHSFVQDNLAVPCGGYENLKLVLINCQDGTILDSDTSISIERDFIGFLTYRSMGNAKRLRELLASFVRPAGRVMFSLEGQSLSWPCDSVLKFDDTEIFRLQLVAGLYNHFVDGFERQLRGRDDKIVTSAFFLIDYVFKFHHRAFSWENLERVDDLVHIHRAPDLRQLLYSIVGHFSERFLHEVLNGLYTFRFRSDIAKEIEYLSRVSPDEMAAFNFTLDESSSLKALFAANLRGDRRDLLPGVVAGLGELYEFDQEFETARQHYRSALRLLDDDLDTVLGRNATVAMTNAGSGNENPGFPAITSILSGDDTGLRNARLVISWGVSRLRLMLQFGMTFEQTRNLERADAEYRDARTLSRNLLRAFLDREGRFEEQASEISDLVGNKKFMRPESRLHSLKHFNLLFQPMFAQAWVAEKLARGIDTGASLIERNLRELRRALPFVREPVVKISRGPLEGRSSNFALIVGQLHNKAGDLFYFKGKSVSDFSVCGFPQKVAAAWQEIACDGYLLRAHYHYAVSLHELRRFLYHRTLSAKYKFSIGLEQKEMLAQGAWPDFIFRSAAGSMSDMAEAMLARVSLFGLLGRVAGGMIPMVTDRDSTPAIPFGELLKKCELWFESGQMIDAEQEPEIVFSVGSAALTLGSLHSWFGKWRRVKSYTKYQGDLVMFEKAHAPEERLVMALVLFRVAASLLERSGYPENAAWLHLQISETVSNYLWWARMAERVDSAMVIREAQIAPEWLKSNCLFSAKNACVFWGFLMDLAVESLEAAVVLFGRGRDLPNLGDATAVNPPGGRGNLYSVTPPYMLTLVCSLALAGDASVLAVDAGDEKRAGRLARLKELWSGWGVETHLVPATAYELNDVQRKLVKALANSVSRFKYPMIGRLKTLKVLIDYHCVRSEDSPSGVNCVRDWIDELLDLSRKFSAPLHFTPTQVGISCLFGYLYWRCASRAEIAKEVYGDDGSWDAVRDAAFRELSAGEEMYTMRRAFYESIADLYYLYDDFNDRQIHFNRAIQMATSDLVSLLKYIYLCVWCKPAKVPDSKR